MEAAADAQSRAAAAEGARDAANAARATAERSRRETEAQARAAAEAADAERDERAAAQGLSEQLKAEADRRAKVFHNAVRAAVAKVQAELEAERDALVARCAPVTTQAPIFFWEGDVFRHDQERQHSMQETFAPVPRRHAKLTKFSGACLQGEGGGACPGRGTARGGRSDRS